MTAEPLTGHRCPTCKTKGKSWLDASTQQVTCEECGQASLVLITPEPAPAKTARRTRKSTTRSTAK
jgi:Zn ribbon nucleic-acid-binding protein